MRKRALALAAAAITSVALFATPGVASARTVPQGFFGVDMDPWALMRTGHSLDAELATAAASGVESIRFPLYWFDVQPYSAMERVPAETQPAMTPATDGGAPFRWGKLDEFVRSASDLGISLLPVIIGAPQWASDPKSKRTFRTPSNYADYARFCAALVNRYGNGGSFWLRDSGMPITTWQIWNEPDIDLYWPQHRGETQVVRVGGKTKRLAGLGFAPTYTSLLKASWAAIKGVDPSSHVMAASLTNRFWVSLKLLYLSGAKGSFDELGANVFSKTASNVISAVRIIRSIMRSNGDGRVPYSATEYSWSSAAGVIPGTAHLGWLANTPAVQAANISSAMELFQRNRSALGIKATYWYTWASADLGNESVWDYAGLRHAGSSAITSKPALSAFASKALKAEGCKRKLVASSCAP